MVCLVASPAWASRRGGLCEVGGDGELWHPLAAKREAGVAQNLENLYTLAVTTEVCNISENGGQLAPPGGAKF